MADNLTFNRKQYSGDLMELKKLAKDCRNSRTLFNLVVDNEKNEDICSIIASNGYCGQKVLERLALNQSALVRYLVAKRGEEIQSKIILVKLARDQNEKVKEQLARTTLSDEIKMILYKREADKNDIIKGYCLKRIQDVVFLKEFLEKATPEELVKYSDSIIANRGMTAETLLFFVKKVNSLNKEQIELLKKHENFKEEFCPMLERFSES